MVECARQAPQVSRGEQLPWTRANRTTPKPTSPSSAGKVGRKRAGSKVHRCATVQLSLRMAPGCLELRTGVSFEGALLDAPLEGKRTTAWRLFGRRGAGISKGINYRMSINNIDWLIGRRGPSIQGQQLPQRSPQASVAIINGSAKSSVQSFIWQFKTMYKP